MSSDSAYLKSNVLLTAPKQDQNTLKDMSFFGPDDVSKSTDSFVKPRMLVSEKGLNFIQDQERSVVAKLQHQAEVKAARQLSYQLAKEEAARLRTETLQPQKRKPISVRANTMITRQNTKLGPDTTTPLDSPNFNQSMFRHAESLLPAASGAENPISPPTLRNIGRERENSQKASFISHFRQHTVPAGDNDSSNNGVPNTVPESTRYFKLNEKSPMVSQHHHRSVYKLGSSPSVDGLQEFKRIVSHELRSVSPGSTNMHTISRGGQPPAFSLLTRHMQSFSKLISTEERQRAVQAKLMRVLGAQPAAASQDSVAKQLEKLLPLVKPSGMSDNCAKELIQIQRLRRVKHQYERLDAGHQRLISTISQKRVESILDPKLAEIRFEDIERIDSEFVRIIDSEEIVEMHRKNLPGLDRRPTASVSRILGPILKSGKIYSETDQQTTSSGGISKPKNPASAAHLYQSAQSKSHTALQEGSNRRGNAQSDEYQLPGILRQRVRGQSTLTPQKKQGQQPSRLVAGHSNTQRRSSRRAISLEIRPK